MKNLVKLFPPKVPKFAFESLRPAALVSSTPIASRYQFNNSSVLAFGRPNNRLSMIFGNTYIAARVSQDLIQRRHYSSTCYYSNERLSNEVGFIGFKLIRQQKLICEGELGTVLFSDADKFMVNSVRNRDWIIAFSKIYRNCGAEEIEHFFDFISRLRAANNWDDKLTFRVIDLFAHYSDRCNILEVAQKMYYQKYKLEDSEVRPFIESRINYLTNTNSQDRSQIGR